MLNFNKSCINCIIITALILLNWINCLETVMFTIIKYEMLTDLKTDSFILCCSLHVLISICSYFWHQEEYEELLKHAVVIPNYDPKRIPHTMTEVRGSFPQATREKLVQIQREEGIIWWDLFLALHLLNIL